MKTAHIQILLAAAGVALAYMAYRDGKKLVTQTFNPAHEDNIINQGVTEIVQGVTGTDHSLGTWLHSVFNPDYENYDPNKN